MYNLGNIPPRKVSKVRSLFTNNGDLSQWARLKVYQCGLLVLAAIVAIYFLWTMTFPPGQGQRRSMDEEIALSKTILLRKLNSPERIPKRLNNVNGAEMDFINGPSPNYANYFDEFGFVERNPESLNQKDGRLIRYVRARFVVAPSQHPYNFHDKNKTKTEVGTSLSQWARWFFNDKRNGGFVELGAGDGGIGTSHTLELEMELGWTGLLIECNPSLGPFLRSTQRKAYTASICVSKSSKYRVANLSFHQWGFLRNRKDKKSIDQEIVQPRPKVNWTSAADPMITLDVETFPLFTLIAGADMKQVDFLLMDFSDTRAFDEYPFTMIPIKVIVIKSVDAHLEEKDKEDLIRFMESKEYILKKKFQHGDYLFVRKDQDAWSLFR